MCDCPDQLARRCTAVVDPGKILSCLKETHVL
ncbi:MAG: hypothetical protein IPF76_10780 [Sphingopyxis sp.]|nr:hypothetical protein [Sphingopyxis sp.]